MGTVVNVNELLADHVQLDVECVDRLYLNGYVPNLQVGGQVVRFLCGHLGNPIPSGAILERIGERFRSEVQRFASRHAIPLVRFAKGERKVERMKPLLAGRRRRGWWRSARRKSSSGWRPATAARNRLPSRRHGSRSIVTRWGVRCNSRAMARSGGGVDLSEVDAEFEGGDRLQGGRVVAVQPPPVADPQGSVDGLSRARPNIRPGALSPTQLVTLHRTRVSIINQTGRSGARALAPAPERRCPTIVPGNRGRT